MAAGYRLAGYPWASLAFPAASRELPLPLVLRLTCKPCLEAVLGRDATAASSCSDIASS